MGNTITAQNLQKSEAINDVKVVIENSFLNGALNKLDTEQMRKGFHPDFAILIGKEEKLNRLLISKWIEVIEEYKLDPEKMNSGDRNAEYKYDIIDVTGKAAIVKIQLFRKGELITTDYLSLIKFPDGWKMVSKVSNEHITNPFNI